MSQNKYTQVIDCWDKTMNVQKPRKETAARKAPVQVEIDLRNNVQVVDSEMNNADELAIDENFDGGGDPYNTTGSHVIIQLQEEADEEE
jgi:hypothetical protein